MSVAKVTLKNEIYEITLTRQSKKVSHFFLKRDFLLMRTDDVDADDFNVDEQGYSHYIFAIKAFQSQHTSTPIEPSEAESILDQIFELTGSYVCDY
jgi:hypothetical protein